VAAQGTIDWAKVCAAIIPSLNEAVCLPDVVTRTLLHLPTVLVVDDGSSDETGKQAAAAGAKIIRHRVNLGKGLALRRGFDHARSLGFTWGLTLDGDGQHAPEDIPSFLRCAEHTGAMLVIGNRLGEPEKIPWVRRFVNRWMTARLSRLTGVPLADSQCGFRLVNLDAVARLRLETSHFEAESELLVKCLRAGLKVEFVPVRVIYRAGRSKIRPVVDTWRWLRWWFAQG
jgi:glycosyltransferase involved in cell wall biosynthesis